MVLEHLSGIYHSAVSIVLDHRRSFFLARLEQATVADARSLY